MWSAGDVAWQPWSLPDCFTNMPSLSRIELRNASVIGTLPNSIGSLSNLEILDLSHNSLTGSIPISYPYSTNLLNLKEFNLNNNELIGYIENDWATKSLLTRFDLGHNKFTGSIPSGFSNLVNLVHLNLSFNQLGGSMFSLDQLTSLVTLHLSNNSLTGEIPNLDHLSQLETVDISQNLFSTFASHNISGTSLKYFYFYSNQFCSSIPPVNSPKLLELIGHSSCLNLNFDWIYQNLQNSSSLAILDLSHNSITGSINFPWDFSQHLTSIKLNDNDLVGSIPTSLVALSTLETLYLQNNNLGGPLPWPLSSSLTGMKCGYLFFNTFHFCTLY